MSGSLAISALSTPNSASSSSAVTTAAAESASDQLSVMMWLSIVFQTAFAALNSRGQVVLDKMQAKEALMKQLETLRQTVGVWNSTVIGDQSQIQETEKILLAGVQIPESVYGRCAYKLSPDSSDIKYSDFPPKIYEDYVSEGKKPGEGELVYRIRENDYKVYTKGGLLDVYSPIPVKNVPGPDVDFSAEEVGALIFVESSKRYYRVAVDGSGVPVTNFPLQKFISTLSDKEATNLDRALENKLTAVRDLSKKDLLDVQEITSLVQVVSTAMIGLLSSYAATSNSVIRNIS